jgi:hypothetical protein
MKRYSVCWLCVMVAVPLAAARGESPRRDSQAASPSPTASPHPKVYHFDISGKSGRAAEPPGPRLEGHTGSPPRELDRQVRPAAALRQGTELEFADETLPLGEAPPKPPVYDPPAVQGADGLPLPYDYAAPGPLWGVDHAPGIGLGGIPSFAHDYCPLYWGNPWESYCCERARHHWRWHFGRVHQTAADLGECPACCPECRCGASHGCGEHAQNWLGGAAAEAPPPPELPAIVPDGTSPSDQTSIPPVESMPPKRRLPRNEIPKAPR